MKRKRVMWMGVVDDAPHFYRSEMYYDGVLHADLFKSKAAAKRCYEEVVRVTIVRERLAGRGK